jgi:hypothetical protein
MNNAQFWGGASTVYEIENSLRFNGNTNNYLERAQVSGSTVNENKNFTFSTWYKHGDLQENCIFGLHTSAENWLLRWSISNGFDSRDTSGVTAFNSNHKARDPYGWYHLFLTMSNGTVSLRINNVLQPSTKSHAGLDRSFILGAETNGGATPMDGYLAETYFIYGSVKDAVNDNFIEVTSEGIVIPKDPQLSSSDYGGQGWYLQYKPEHFTTSGGTTTLADQSGLGNNFTATNFTLTGDNNDIKQDSPTVNYATLDPLWSQAGYGSTISDGNAQLNTDNSVRAGVGIRFPVGMKGKYYCECSATHTGAYSGALCVAEADRFHDGNVGNINAIEQIFLSGLRGNGYSKFGESSTTSITSGVPGIGLDFDKTDGKVEITYYTDGTLRGTDTGMGGSGDHDQDLMLQLRASEAGYNSVVAYIECGQDDPTFNNRLPTGFKPLAATSIPTPTIKDGRDHFDVVEYTGTSSGTKAITSLKFKPDFIWFKSNSHGTEHNLFDSVRGESAGYLQFNATDKNNTSGAGLESFDDNGFTVSAPTGNELNNGGGRTYIAHCWKAGGAPTATNDNAAGAAQDAGSVKVDGSDGSFAHGTIRADKMSVNTTAKFSIVEYTGTGTAGTVPHGLGQKPHLIFIKNTGPSSVTNRVWVVYTKESGNTHYMLPPNQDVPADDANQFNDSGPDANTFSIGTSVNVNESGTKYIAYVWSIVPGFFHVGQIINANGDAAGQTITLGFKPSFLVVKRASGGNGHFYGWSAVNGDNNTPNTGAFLLNDSSASVATDDMDFYCNGAKPAVANSDFNAINDEYIYWAWAQHPFNGNGTSPATAF